MIAKLAGPAYQALDRQKKCLLLIGPYCLFIGAPLYWLQSTRLVNFNVESLRPAGM